LLDMPLRVVQRVRQVWNEIGEVARHRTRSGRAPLMSRMAVDVPSLFRTTKSYRNIIVLDDAWHARAFAGSVPGRDPGTTLCFTWP
jgi:hypothetical protein